MVRVAPPPPDHTPNPLILHVPAGNTLVRIFDPTSFGATAVGFRFYGPLRRFDHQEGRGPEHLPGDDVARGIYYAGFSLSCCLVEVFGDTGVIDFGTRQVAYPRLKRTLSLLDLRDAGAMRAGTVAAIAKVPDLALTQSWSRFVYGRSDVYTSVDGLIYYNAHNDEEALALYERAEDALECSSHDVLPLHDSALEDDIFAAADRHNLIV